MHDKSTHTRRDLHSRLVWVVRSGVFKITRFDTGPEGPELDGLQARTAEIPGSEVLISEPPPRGDWI